jgi:hypothetical protein
MEGWSPRFRGSIEGRVVVLSQYHSGELKVETTQLKTETTEGSFEPGSTVFPAVVSAGNSIVIEANTPDELVKELMACGFSQSGALEIARHGRLPAA